LLIIDCVKEYYIFLLLITYLPTIKILSKIFKYLPISLLFTTINNITV